MIESNLLCFEFTNQFIYKKKHMVFCVCTYIVFCASTFILVKLCLSMWILWHFPHRKQFRRIAGF